ncbi:MAG TPA: hypothetical protein DEG69_09985 [Flavobacteriaceae bacterium]|nr:hypothetical protein [Flavobacteriaceae bacterium]
MIILESDMKANKHFKVTKECKADMSKCHFIENVLVAHHTQRYLSTLNIDQMSDSISVIAEQNNLDICFYKEYTPDFTKIWVKYDITDMLLAMDIYEKSVLLN